jgi:ATP-binding cassette, subfamily B, multidrug efflux pump
MLKELAKPFQYEKIVSSQKPAESKSGKKRPKAKNFSQTLKRVWWLLSYEKGLLFTVLFLVLISSVLGLLGPYLIGTAVDEYIVGKKQSGLMFILVSLAAVYIFYSLSLWLQNYWMIGISQRTVYKLRSSLFRHLHQLPISFFDKRQHGELMSRMTNDIENVSSTLNSSVIQIFSSLLMLIGTVAVMLWLSPVLTLITLLIVPMMFLGMKWITNRTSELFKAQQKNIGDINGFIEETISGQRIIKAFSQEKKVIDEFQIKNTRLKGSGFWAQTYSGFIPKLMNLLNNMSFTIIAGVGGILALNGYISVGVMIIFAEYSRQFTRPLNDLANQFNTLLSAVAGAERVFEILDEKTEEQEGEGFTVLQDVKGEVCFENVSFSYEKGGDTLNDINFMAKKGETIALVGPTGAGKSTILNLLSRFYEAAEGEIFIDGIAISTIKRQNLREQMAFVLQDPFLFQGTIRENIRYGKLAASDDEVEVAAKLANAHSFIMRLPKQYETVLTQDGSGISQGQKQLLSIARALVANPKILILDEATSNIDTVTELKIQEALQRLLNGRTSFVIAHRLNTIQKADCILVLKDGRIIEKGSHEELLFEKGFYSDLYQSQLKKTSYALNS